MPKTARDIAERWNRNLSAAGQTITSGVNAVTESPTEKAAAAVDRMVAGVQRAAAEGKIQRGLQAVTLASWKDSMIKKAVPRIAQGAAAATGKVESFMGQLLPHIDAGKRSLESMPRGDANQNQARMLFWFQHMQSFRKR